MVLAVEEMIERQRRYRPGPERRGLRGLRRPGRQRARGEREAQGERRQRAADGAPSGPRAGLERGGSTSSHGPDGTAWTDQKSTDADTTNVRGAPSTR